MSFDPSEPGVSPEFPQPQKPGRSRSSKVLMILGITGGGLIVLCCGGIVAIFLFGKYYFGKAISTDPAVVRQVADKIVSIDVPDVLQPKMSMDMKNPVSGQPMMTLAMYADQSQKSMLILGSFGEAFAAQGEQQMQAQLRAQGGPQQENVEITERFDRQIDVRGKPVSFFFAKGKDTATGEPRIQVTGTFQGPHGTVMLMLHADEKTLDEDQIVKMIKSIK